MQEITNVGFLMNVPAKSWRGCYEALIHQSDWFKLIPPRLSEIAISMMTEDMCYFQAPDIVVGDHTIRLHFMGTPYTSSALLDSNHLFHWEACQRLTETLASIQKRSGNSIKVLGLGAATAIAMGHGNRIYKESKSLATPIPIVTSGNTITAALSVEIARQVVAQRKIDSRYITVYGGLGSVGSRVVDYAIQAFKPDKLTVVSGTKKDVSSIIKRHPGTEIILGNESQASSNQVIFCAASSLGPVEIKEDCIPEGGVIIDIGKPRNTDPKLAKDRPDVAVIDGSLAQLPEGTQWEIPCKRLGLHPNTVFGCLAETIVLGYMYSLGRLKQYYGESTFIGRPEAELSGKLIYHMEDMGMKPYVTEAHPN